MATESRPGARARAAHVTVSNADYYETLREDAAEGETTWTVGTEARKGDTVYLYVARPYSAIVATAILAADPAPETDIQSDWYGHPMADMHSLRMLAVPLTRAVLMREIPGWGWPRQPRSNCRVPEKFRGALVRLLN